MLSDETFRSMVSALRCSPPSGAHAPENRAAQRMPCTGEGTMILVDAQDRKSHTVSVANLSMGGVSIQTDQILRKGQRFILHVANPDAEKRHAVLCSVAYVQPLPSPSGEPLSNVGANFIRELAIAAADETTPSR